MRVMSVFGMGGALLSICLPLLCKAEADGGYTFDTTRIIYPETAHKGVTSVITNNSPNAVMVQSGIMAANASGDVSGIKAPFIVVPPLFLLKPGDKRVLKIIRTGGDFPTDKESLFYLSSRIAPALAVPERNTPHSAQLNLGVMWQMKLFYRPEGLTARGGVAAALNALTVAREGNALRLTNPGPYWLTLDSLTVGKQAVSGQALMRMLPPGGLRTFALPGGQVVPAGKTTVSWRGLNELGLLTPPKNQPPVSREFTGR